MNENNRNSPWKEMYEKMGRECPQNDIERHVLEMLAAGEDLSDCLKYWRSNGNNEESFFIYEYQ